MAFGIKRKEKRFARTLRREDQDFDEEETKLEDDDEESKSRKRTFKKSDFKDLNPKDKKARKEPVKPWGKKERYLVLSLIIITAGISAFLFLSASGWKLPANSKLKFFTFSIQNIFKEETIVLPK